MDVSVIRKWVERDVEAILPRGSQISQIVDEILNVLTANRSTQFMSVRNIRTVALSNFCAGHLGRFADKFVSELVAFLRSYLDIYRYDYDTEYRR